MQFIENENDLGFEEFTKKYSEEAKILTNFNEPNIKYLLNGDEISLVFEDFSPIKIQILNTLKKHEVFFYKHSIYKDPLAKAIGLKKGKRKPKVLDATAGMMGDSLLIQSYGIEKLICFERNPYVAALIVNAIKLANIDIDFYFGSALSLELKDEIDVVFYDPMYNEKNSKAAPKKEMAIFRKMIGPDLDISEIATELLTLPKERLVIKRSNKSKPVIENPSHTIKGKSTSYDVYLT